MIFSEPIYSELIAKAEPDTGAGALSMMSAV